MDKDAIRERIWDALEESGVARFPFPPHDRIPNFEGAERAAERLAETDAWVAAETVKANPDAPQLPVRRRALHEGKTVFMAVPRLRDEECFLELDPDRIGGSEALEKAATVSRARDHARQVGPADVPPVDLIVAGSVAVSESGDRIGKGEGYSDLEYAILAEAGLVDSETTVVTTVHEMQVVADDWRSETYDVPMDLVVTPERVIRTDRRGDRPSGIDWDVLEEGRIEEIPVLERLRGGGG
ncbi:MAG: 5-formyltetrahydrofolate cyclo-ligase [Halodesulfurarchaeum sp.]